MSFASGSAVLKRVSLCFCLLLCGECLSLKVGAGVSETLDSKTFDVVNYNAQIEPEFRNKSLKGRVVIRVVSNIANLSTVEFDCGELTTDAVQEHSAAQRFEAQQHRLKITLSRPAKLGETREIDIAYHGIPKYGIRFFPDQSQVYTIFSTSQWMVCVDAPEDKATLSMKLIVPAGLTPVANGRLVNTSELPDRKFAYQWEQ